MVEFRQSIWIGGAYAALVAGLAVVGGTPALAAQAIAAGIFFLSTGLFHLGKSPRATSWDAVLKSARRIPIAVRFLIIAFVVTSIFALEMRVDVVPNAFGFLELTLPVILSAILFDVSGGLFCAVATMLFGFKAIAPPRYEPILDLSSFSGALFAFTALAISAAVYFPAVTHGWSSRLQIWDEWDSIGRWWTQRPLESAQASAIEEGHGWLIPVALVLLYGMAWALFAFISSGNGVHIDSLEAYAWGREFIFGYYKHPPFWAWVSGIWFLVFPKTDLSFLVLSELNGGLGLLGAWAVMGRFSNQRIRLLGVLLLMLTPFYQFNAQRFNANTVLLSIWPWTIYFFIRSIETNRIIYALLCGLFAGCAMLSKYFGLVLIATCFVASLTHHARQQYYRSAAPYVAVLTAAAVFLPHVLWLIRDGFQPLIYLSTKIDLADRHISNSYFTFIAANFAFFLIPVAMLIWARLQSGRSPEVGMIALENGRSFLTVIAFAPFVLTLVAGTIGHTALAVPFGVPIFATLPLCLILYIRPDIGTANWLAGRVAGAMLAVCLLASPVLPSFFIRFGSDSYTEPRLEITEAAIKLWKEKTGAPLRYVSGDRDLSLSVTFSSRDDTSEFNEFSFRRSPWVTGEGLRRRGLLVICRAEASDCLTSAAAFSTDQTQTFEVSVSRKAAFAQGRPWAFKVIVIPPAATSGS